MAARVWMERRSARTIQPRAARSRRHRLRDLSRECIRDDGGRARHRAHDGILRGLPQTKTGFHRLSHVPLLRINRGWIDAALSGSPQHPAQVRPSRAAGILKLS